MTRYKRLTLPNPKGSFFIDITPDISYDCLNHTLFSFEDRSGCLNSFYPEDLLLSHVMQNKLFVGSLPWATDDAALSELFSQFGEVTSARVMTDKFTGRSRGFGFVEFANDADAAKAVAALDGSTLGGRQIVVNIARPPQERT